MKAFSQSTTEMFAQLLIKNLWMIICESSRWNHVQLTYTCSSSFLFGLYVLTNFLWSNKRKLILTSECKHKVHVHVKCINGLCGYSLSSMFFTGGPLTFKGGRWFEKISCKLTCSCPKRNLIHTTTAKKTFMQLSQPKKSMLDRKKIIRTHIFNYGYLFQNPRLLLGGRKKVKFHEIFRNKYVEKQLISWEIHRTFWGKFCWKMIGKTWEFAGQILLESNRICTDLTNVLTEIAILPFFSEMMQ